MNGSRRRVDSIDVVRGVVMILMALDHVRDFVGLPGNPTDPARASAWLFATRWITHICAPTFFLLTGVGAYFSGRRRDAAALSRFLIARGLWLILLELTVVRCLGYQFNADYRVTMLVILWALGWAMVVLGLLVPLPLKAIGAFGVVLIATHNLTDGIAPRSLGAWAPLWSVLHVPGVILPPPHVLFVAYPLVPWIGVTALGYAIGPVFTSAPERRRSMLLAGGIALSVGFVLVRFANVYGDPVRWTVQASPMRTVLSFLNATKYPPSLQYLMMTLGPSALLLYAAEKRSDAPWLRPVRVFGSVPLFYFLLHLPLIHLVALVICFVRYGAIHWVFESSRLDQYPFAAPPGWGVSLPAVYAIWVGVVVALYPLCRWYAGVKGRRAAWWLSYL